MIILHTIKGKSCCFAEAKLDNHNMFFSAEMIDQAISCVSEELPELLKAADAAGPGEGEEQ